VGPKTCLDALATRTFQLNATYPACRQSLYRVIYPGSSFQIPGVQRCFSGSKTAKSCSKSLIPT